MSLIFKRNLEKHNLNHQNSAQPNNPYNFFFYLRLRPQHFRFYLFLLVLSCQKQDHQKKRYFFSTWFQCKNNGFTLHGFNVKTLHGFNVKTTTKIENQQKPDLNSIKERKYSFCPKLIRFAYYFPKFLMKPCFRQKTSFRYTWHF